jgi:TRAP-type C4-dicarboxylate transport system permease small subunit
LSIPHVTYIDIILLKIYRAFGAWGMRFLGLVVSKALTGLKKLNSVLDAIVNIVAPSIIGLIFLLVFSEIMGGIIFHESLDWMNEFPPRILAFVVFPLFGVIYRSKRHVAVEFVSDRLRETPSKMLSLFINILMVYGSYIIGRGAIELMASFYATGSMSHTEFRVPMWIFATSLVMGAIFLLLCSIELMVADALWLISRKKKAEAS